MNSTKTSKKHASKMIDRITRAIACVCADLPWVDPPREGESEWMKHERVAQQVANTVGMKLNKSATGWAILKEDCGFQYAVRVQDFVVFLDIPLGSQKRI